MAPRTAIGLDIGTSGVRAAELTFGKSGITLEKFGQVALPEGAVRDGEVVQPGAVTEAIKQLWEHTKFSGKEVIVVGGGLSLVGEPLRAAIAGALPRYVMDSFRPGPRVALAGLGEDSVPVGALALAAAAVR